MSVNAATVNSITNNIVAIINALPKYLFESDAIDSKINAWVQLNLGGDTEDENHGEGPMYIEQRYQLLAQREIIDKNDHRTKSAQIKWDLKEAITVAALNVKDLEISRLVSLVELGSSVNDYNSSEGLIVDIDLMVRFRDLRT